MPSVSKPDPPPLRDANKGGGLVSLPPPPLPPALTALSLVVPSSSNGSAPGAPLTPLRGVLARPSRDESPRVARAPASPSESEAPSVGEPAWTGDCMQRRRADDQCHL